jgi:hypothetical protein
MKERIYFIEAVRRQLECCVRDKRIRGVQQAHHEGTPSLEEGARRACVTGFFRVDTICYALLRMEPQSISYAEAFLVLSCGKFKYDRSS